MAEPLGLRMARALIRATAWLVPAGRREAWRREWEGEVAGRWRRVDGRNRTMVEQLDIVRRTAGCVPDAIYIRRGEGMMRGWMDDLVGGARSLRRHPRYTAIVVVTLAMGVGLTAAIFGTARDVLLRPFPYPDAEQVVAVAGFDVDRPGTLGNVTYPNLSDLSESSESVREFALARWWIPAHEDEDGARVVRGATVTANFFDVLGVAPGLGRFFHPGEQGDGREAFVVLSHGYWQERFGSDPGVVGESIRLSGVSYEVIGVTDESFEDPWLLGGPGSQPQLWRTVASPPSEWPRSGRSWRGIARLSENVPLMQAQAEVDGSFARLVDAWPEHNTDRRIALVPLREFVSGSARPVLLLLSGGAGLLLLIACANLANLMLGRAMDRRAEVLLQRALGADDIRIVRTALMEVGLLTLAGGVAGLGVAVLLGRAARAAGALLPRPVTGVVDLNVVAFAMLTSTFAAILFGLGPSLHALRTGFSGERSMSGRRFTSGPARERSRRSLVVGQVALTAVLLVACGLLGRSFLALGQVDLGLTTERVFGVEIHGSAWADLDPSGSQAQWADVLRAVRAVPGVEQAGAIDYLPLGGSYSCDGVYRADVPAPAPGEGRCAEVRVVLPGALGAMGIDVVRGRAIERSDDADGSAVVVIDESLAESLWPGGDPIGGRIHVHTREHEVVGVTRDMRHFGPGRSGAPMLYLPAPQEAWNGVQRGLALVYRSDGTVDIRSIQAAVHSINPRIALGDLVAFEDLLRETLALPRFRAVLMAAFGVAALLQALLGIGGILAFSVARRTREMGVRVALGARPQEVRHMVLREGAMLTVLGLSIGLFGVALLAGVIESMLFQVRVWDPVVWGGVVMVLGGAATLACWLPARRASAVQPIEALASE